MNEILKDFQDLGFYWNLSKIKMPTNKKYGWLYFLVGSLVSGLLAYMAGNPEGLLVLLPVYSLGMAIAFVVEVLSKLF